MPFLFCVRGAVPAIQAIFDAQGGTDIRRAVCVGRASPKPVRHVLHRDLQGPKPKQTYLLTHNTHLQSGQVVLYSEVEKVCRHGVFLFLPFPPLSVSESGENCTCLVISIPWSSMATGQELQDDLCPSSEVE